MVVDHREGARASDVVGEDAHQRLARPGRGGAAVEDAVRVVVLPAAHRPLKRRGAFAGDELVEAAARRRLARLAPFARTDRLVQLLVAVVARQRLAVVDEVAVEVDILLGDAADPGEAVRVDGVDGDQRRAPRQLAGEAVLERADLDARAAEPLGAMRRRDGEEHARRVLRAEYRDIGGQLLAVRPPRRVLVAEEPRPGTLRRIAKLAARLGVAGGEMGGGRHRQGSFMCLSSPLAGEALRQLLRRTHCGALGRWGDAGGERARREPPHPPRFAGPS